jgi:superfamily II DNA or RNA helicase
MTSEIAHYNYLTMKLMHAASAGEEQFRRIARMRGLMSFTSKEKYAKLLLNEAKDKCIVFANTHDQADKICRHSYHSSNPDSDENLMKFKVGIITKLSAVLQLNEGVNIPELKQGIILHAYGNERKSSQRIGRLLRLNPEDVATVHILCYRDTVDEAWTREALSSFDSSKIQYLEV